MIEGHPFENKKKREETSFFEQVIQNYLPYWVLFALIIPVCLFIAFINYRAQAPVYVASAKNFNQGS